MLRKPAWEAAKIDIECGEIVKIDHSGSEFRVSVANLLFSGEGTMVYEAGAKGYLILGTVKDYQTLCGHMGT